MVVRVYFDLIHLSKTSISQVFPVGERKNLIGAKLEMFYGPVL
jgi:hypothetical protein